MPKDLMAQVERNQIAIRLEKEGKTDEAIDLYEKNIAENFGGNHPYERLAILYRKRKQKSDEIRVLERAVEVFRNVISEQRPDRGIKLRRFERVLELAKGTRQTPKSSPLPITPENASEIQQAGRIPAQREVPQRPPTLEELQRSLSGSYLIEPPSGFSPAEIEFLSLFRSPRVLDNTTGREIYGRRLGTNYMDIIQKWMDKGILTDQFPPYDVIYYGMRMAEIKDVLRDAGLKLSGAKDALVQRIVEAGQNVTRLAMQECPSLYGCTSAGRIIVDSYLQRKETIKVLAIAQARKYLSDGDVKTAVAIADAFQKAAFILHPVGSDLYVDIQHDGNGYNVQMYRSTDANIPTDITNQMQQRNSEVWEQISKDRAKRVRQIIGKSERVDDDLIYRAEMELWSGMFKPPRT